MPNAQEYLTFTKGLCAVEEPDIWACTFDDRISLWIDVGEPAVERIKEATRQAQAVKVKVKVKVYSFNSKSDTWWKQGQTKFSELPVSLYRFPWESIQALATLVKRTMHLSVTITGDTSYVAADQGECAIPCLPLQVAAS